jgi:hypothetical protein
VSVIAGSGRTVLAVLIGLEALTVAGEAAAQTCEERETRQALSVSGEAFWPT